MLDIGGVKEFENSWMVEFGFEFGMVYFTNLLEVFEFTFNENDSTPIHINLHQNLGSTSAESDKLNVISSTSALSTL